MLTPPLMTPFLLLTLLDMGEAEIIDVKTYQLLLKWQRPQDAKRLPLPMQELDQLNSMHEFGRLYDEFGRPYDDPSTD